MYSAWFAQHTEHRLVVGNLFFWADFALFGGKAAFLHFMNLVLLGALAGLTLWAILDGRARSSAMEPALALGGATTAICFSWLQHENINWGFQTSFFVSLVLPFASFIVLQLALARSSSSLLVCSLLLGTLSAGTMANGLAVLPLMAIALLVVRRPSWAALFALFSVGLTALYFVDYRTPVLNAALTESLSTKPLQMVRYTFTFLGGIFGHSAGGAVHQPVAETAGAIGLATLGILLLLAWSREGISGWTNCSTLFLGYVVASAVATSAGRINFGLEQALSSRYLTYSLLFWATLLPLALLPVQLTALRPADDRNLNRLVAALAFELGVRDEKQIEWVFPWIDVGFTLAKLPRERNQSVFGDPRLRDRRELLGTTAPTGPSACIAELNSRDGVPGDPDFDRVSGWIERSDDVTSAPTVVGLVNAAGSYVGFAIVGTANERRFDASKREVTARPFKGYARTGSDNASLSIVGLEPPCSVAAVKP
jgi:hypothetical protein